MSWLCLIKHKWIYKVEDITFLQGVYSSYLVTKPTDVRYCQRCCKKQKSRWSRGYQEYFRVNPKILSNKDWISWELNKSEKRDKKLKELGL